MAICYCISGQLRNFRPAFERLKSQLNIEDRVVICVWRGIGGKIYGPLGFNQLKRLIHLEILKCIPACFFDDSFEVRLNPVFRAVQKNLQRRGDISEQELRSFFPDATIEIHEDTSFGRYGLSDLPPSLQNQGRMLFMIARANFLKSELEALKGHRFETVVRMRPELDLKDYKIEPAVAGHIVVDWFDPLSKVVGDIFWVGTSEDLDMLSAFWDQAYQPGQSGGAAHLDWAYHHSIYAGVVRGGLTMTQAQPQPKLTFEQIDDEEVMTALAASVKLSPSDKELRAVHLAVESLRLLRLGLVEPALDLATQAVVLAPNLPNTWRIKRIVHQQARHNILELAELAGRAAGLADEARLEDGRYLTLHYFRDEYWELAAREVAAEQMAPVATQLALAFPRSGMCSFVAAHCLHNINDDILAKEFATRAITLEPETHYFKDFMNKLGS